MGAIRLAPRDTSFETPASFDPGVLDFYGTLAYDSLYHSPASAIYRGASLAYQDFFGSEDVLEPQAAQEKYGLEGALTFDEPIKDSAAKLMYQRKVAEFRREQILTNGFDHGGVGRGAVGFGVSLGASLLDPINFASMFVPVVGQTRALSGVARAGSRVKSLTTTLELARTFGANPNAIRLATGAVEGAVGQALVEPLVLFPNLYEQSDYGWQDSITNIGAGVVLGAGLHFSLGKLGDKFSEIVKALEPRFNRISNADGTALSPSDWVGIEEDTHREIIQATLAQLTQDEPVTAAGDLIELDRKAVFDDLRNDIFERSRQQIGEYYLRQSRVGYELLVDQYKNKGSRLGWDTERVNAEIEKEIGPDFETKVRQELTGTEDPVEFNKDIQTSQIAEFENKFLELFEVRGVSRGPVATTDEDTLVKFLDIKERYLDFVFEEAHENGYLGSDLEESREMFEEFRSSLEQNESVPRSVETDHPFEKISENPEALSAFNSVYQQALKKGYDLNNSEIEMLSETVRFKGKDFEAVLTGDNEPSSSYKLLARKDSIGLYVKDIKDTKRLIETVGLDIEHPVQKLQTKAGKANFTRLYKEALSRGYNLHDAEIRMGQESLVFLTKNRAVKFSSEDLSANEIPGLTTITEYKSKRGDMHMAVSERVVPLSKEFKDAQIEKGFEELSSILGKGFDDAQKQNLGINARGEIVLLDTGNITDLGESSTAKPRTKLAKQILAQIEANKAFSPKVTEQDIQNEIQKRIKSLRERKRKQVRKEQRALDAEPEISPARESVLLQSPIRKTPEPVEPLTAEKLKEHTTELAESDYQVEDLNDLFAEGLDFDEARYVQSETADLKNISKLKKALEKGINCITKKQV